LIHIDSSSGIPTKPLQHSSFSGSLHYFSEMPLTSILKSLKFDIILQHM